MYDSNIVCVFKDHLRSGELVDLREREPCPAQLHALRRGSFLNTVGLMEACGREIS